MDLSEIYNKMRGLTDLLHAVAAQIESGDCLRIEGAMMLASISSDIEHSIESLMPDDA